VTGARGSVLLHVLIMSLVTSLMCAAVLRTRLQPALTAADAVSHVQDDLAAQAALNRVTEAWSRLGSCASDESVGIHCEGGGACACVCAVAAYEPGVSTATVTAAPSGGACRLTAARE
jgi:hypothetical protein